MTALDDALNSSSIQMGPHQLQAFWREISNADIASPDALGNLTGQSDGSYTVEHSLDDALPDPVTLTTGNEAAGIFSAGLIGREAQTLSAPMQQTFHASAVQTGAGTRTVTVPYPSNAVAGDFLVCAILVNSPTTMVIQTTLDPKDAWEYLGTVVENVDISMHIYVTHAKAGGLPFQGEADVSCNWLSMVASFGAISTVGTPLRYRLLNKQLTAEVFPGTNHTVTSKLSNKGYMLGIFGAIAAAGPLAAGTGVGVEWGESVQNGLDLMMSTSTFRDAGSYTLEVVTSVVTATLIMCAIGVEPYERPRMDASQYFSPFNRFSPVYGFERSSAEVISKMRVLTADGPTDTQVFKGQMQDIPVRGRGAELSAVSKSRILMNRSVVLPVVTGSRENMGIDWLATWLMARGGSFAGAAPNQYTRHWYTMYGSIHATWGNEFDYNMALTYDAALTPAGPYGRKYPTTVIGPHGRQAMFAQQTATRTDEILLEPKGQAYRNSTDDFPHLYEDGGTGPLMIDQFSQVNSKGRVSFWVRGDAAVFNPAYLVGAGPDCLFQVQVACTDSTGAWLGYVRLFYKTDTRSANITMGCSSNGFGGVSLSGTFAIPTDGNWHFVAFWWDYAAGQYHIKVDGNNLGSISTFFATGGWNYTADLPQTEEQLRRVGGKVNVTIHSHLPISDVLVDSGNPTPDPVTGWDDLYPTPATPGGNATFSPTFQGLEGIAEPTAVNAWDLFTELARNSLSAYRCDENDALNFLYLHYFGEPARMTPAAVQSTETNTGEIDASIDNSRMRNVITVKFMETRVDSSPQPVLWDTTGPLIPRGTSTFTFPLDIPAMEIHGAASKDAPEWQILTLTDHALWATAPGSLPAGRHFVTPNPNSDGSYVLNALHGRLFGAEFVSVDAQSVTIKFVNWTPWDMYLVNNNQEVAPGMRILGYAVRSTEGYVTVRDDRSVAIRGERSLDVEMPWIHRRNTAMDIASLLCNMLANPRPQMGLTVVGDPRRKPGDLVAVQDASGTAAEGTWRVLSTKHSASGAQYTQDLQVIRQYPAARWGYADGWGIGVWSDI